MKPKQLHKKLRLNKKTISDLTSKEMSHFLGGYKISTKCPVVSFDPSCPSECVSQCPTEGGTPDSNPCCMPC
jgi:natural product precursor